METKVSTLKNDGSDIVPQTGIGTSPSSPDDDKTNARIYAAFFEGEQIMRFFAFGHLKPEQREVSRPFAHDAIHAIESLPRCAERTAGLRKLLEAKDCFVRASLPEPTR